MRISRWLANRIIYLCSEKKISINQLALDSDLTQSTLNSIVHGESKNPKLVTLLKICRGLNISLNELLQDIDSEKFEEIED